MPDHDEISVDFTCGGNHLVDRIVIPDASFRFDAALAQPVDPLVQNGLRASFLLIE